MSEPLVCAIMPTKDRPEMAVRAVRSFRGQTYQNKRLLIYAADEASQRYARDIVNEVGSGEIDGNAYGVRPSTIGAMRNQAISLAGDVYNPQIFIHFDDDDWSHSNRIAEQVSFLQSSGADAVGYNEMLFWDWRIVGRIASDVVRITEHGIEADVIPINGEAWLFKNSVHPPGTSLCYWRKTWERKPFPDTSEAEDRKWCMGLNVATQPGFGAVEGNDKVYFEGQPRIIASIHGGNTSDYDIEGMIRRGSQNWRRAPEWDSYCAERMKL